MKRTRWLWLLPVLVLMWVAGAAAELRKSLLLERQGASVVGRLVSAEWVVTKGGRALLLEASWAHGGKTYRDAFRLPATVGAAFVDLEGLPLVEEVELRYVPSSPEIAVVAAFPGDPAWVGMVVGGIGITAFFGVIWFLAADRRRVAKAVPSR